MSHREQLGTAIYEPSPIKRRRATKSEMAARAKKLLEIAGSMQPCSVRMVFYQATSVHRILEKEEASYKKVQRQLVDLRQKGLLPWHWIVDNTRSQRKPISFDSLAEAAENTASAYRRAVWADLDTHVEVWLEKDALAGVLYPVTAKYDVPLMIARGYSSLTFLHASASYMRQLGKKVVIFHFGDYDPSGRDAADKIEQTLKKFAPEIDITFRRVAVTPEQIKRWGLPSRPTKKTDSRAKKWTDGDSVELDAIDANTLRQLCESCTESVIPKGWLDTIRAAEESERDLLRRWAAAVGKAA
jgi:hypothetical protein